jgi:hypothetical protein
MRANKTPASGSGRDPRRGRALRALLVLADERGQPERGVVLVQEALLADPFSGNSWQDLARVYGRALGVPVK